MEMVKNNRIPGLAHMAITLGALATLTAVPAPRAQANMFKPSASQQKQAGAQAARDVQSKYRMVGGAPLARVQRVGSRLVSRLGGRDRSWDYSFHVIDSKEVNAFALPGGNVYIFTGLLNRLGNDNELAAVLGHEMTHVRREHWANMVADSQKRSLGLGVLLGITKADRGWYNVAGVANGLMDLRYSRKDEDQADAGGLSNMVAAGYNPNGMLQLFSVLQSAAKEGSTPTFLRDHPLTSDRIRKTQERIAQMRR